MKRASFTGWVSRADGPAVLLVAGTEHADDDELAVARPDLFEAIDDQDVDDDQVVEAVEDDDDDQVVEAVEDDDDDQVVDDVELVESAPEPEPRRRRQPRGR